MIHFIEKMIRAIGLNRSGKDMSLRRFTPEEFRSFCIAGKVHHITPGHVYEDFRAYLRRMNVPAYVTESVRTSRRRKK